MKRKRLRQLKSSARKDDTVTVQRGLSKIYSNKDGSLPDISHLEVKHRNRWKIFLVGFLIVAFSLTALAWLGFLIFGSGNQSGNNSLKLSFEGPRNIASGDEVTYILAYENIEKVPLRNVKLILRYPDSFEFISATPAPTNNFNSSWDIGDLSRSQKGQIEIKGTLIGEVGSVQTINATASFEPENFSSTFKESTSFSSQITSSILEITVEGPEQILPEKKAEYKIKYRNASDQKLEKIKIIAQYPTSFVFQTSEPEPFSREDDARKFNNQWLLDVLEQNQEGEIVVTGGYVADEQVSNVDFTVQIGFFDEASQTFSLQQQQTWQTAVVNHGLSLNLIINGSTSDQSVGFDQLLTYSLVYKNLGQFELDDVIFSVTIDSDVVDWDQLEDKHEGSLDRPTITWSKDQISQFDLIRPLDEGTIDFSIPIKAADDINLTTDNLQTVSQATAQLKKIGELEIDELIVESNQIANNINTDIQFKVEGRYFDDDNIAVGTGPLPPVVGQTTTFRIYWSIANSLNPVKDVTVTAVLPDNIEWADKFLIRAGGIDYRSQDNTITWTIDRIAPNAGFNQTTAWFDLAVTPSKDQVKRLLILIDQSVMTATDTVTDSPVRKTGKAITSNLEDDPIGGGRGLVIDITE